MLPGTSRDNNSAKWEGARRNLIFRALVGAVIFGCVTVTEPDAEEDALVMSRLVLYYPDGFVGSPPQDLNHGVPIVFRDPATATIGCPCPYAAGLFWSSMVSNSRARIRFGSSDRYP